MDTLRQRVRSLQVSVLPDVPCTAGFDGFGNPIIEGTVAAEHSSFSVDVQGVAEVPSAESDRPIPEQREEGDGSMVFKYNTARTAPGPAIRKLMESVPAPSGDIISDVADIMHLVHSSLRYEKGVTCPETTAEEAMAGGSGVCQDYSHIMLAILRSRGVPCRYVVGYTVGEGESHAWAEVLCDGVWYGMDPTGDSFVGPRHIKVSHGRDYDDCRINRGVFFGARSSSQLVHALVSPVQDQEVRR